jgi:hypothetical protein
MGRKKENCVEETVERRETSKVIFKTVARRKQQ